MGSQIDGLPGALVYIGLGQPWARAFCAGTLVGLAAYATKLPPQCFDEDGKIRPMRGLSASPDATYAHFLAVPVTAAAIACVFT